jgi:hypothetical protein
MKFDEHFIKERTGHLENISNMDSKIAHSCVDYWSVFTIDQFKIQMTKEKIPRNPYLIYFLDAQFVLL